MNKIKSKLSMASLLFFLLAATQAQTVTVKKQSEKIKAESVEGYTAELQGKSSDIHSQWNKFLKDVGRVKLFSSNPVTITSPRLNGTAYPNGVLYAYVFEQGNQSRVWLGIVPREWEGHDVDSVNQQVKKLVYRFGIQFYQSKVQNEINETQHAIDAVEKQKQKLVTQNKDLIIQQSNIAQEKVQLEKSLEGNKLEAEAVKKKLEKNVKAQDSLVNATTQIKKVMEAQKDRLRKIN